MFARISTVVLVGFLLVALGGVFQAAAQTEDNKAIYRRIIEEVFNKGDLAVLDEIVATDHVNHSDNLHGPEEYKQFVTMYRTAFPDLHMAMEDQIAEGDKVLNRFTSTGTHQGDLMGIPPTGRQVIVTAIYIARIADGKIAEEWGNFDALGMLQQIGVIPPMPELADVLPPVMNRKPEDYPWSEPSDITGDPGNPESNKALLVRYNEELNQGNLDVYDEVFDPRLVFHDPSWPIVTDFASWKAVVASVYEMFPDHQAIVDDIIAEGDKVASRWTTRWTDPATGQANWMTGVDIDRFADGKVVETWRAKDFLSLMQRSGVIPPLGPTAVESRTWGQVKALFK